MSKTTMHNWLHPPKKNGRKLGRSARPARSNRRQNENEQLGKKVKGPVGDAYANVRRALQRLEWAREQAPNQEARMAIAAAMRSLYNAEDAIGEGLRQWSVASHQADVSKPDLRAVS